MIPGSRYAIVLYCKYDYSGYTRLSSKLIWCQNKKEIKTIMKQYPPKLHSLT